MTYYRPKAISEVYDPDGHVDDCPWVSGVMFANAISGGTHPATLAEAEAVEVAAGGPYPSGSPNLVYRGLNNRYGITPGVATSADALMAQAKPGTSLVVSGRYGQLPTHLRRFSPFFTGGHELYVGVETPVSAFLIDPLAHDEPGYAGEGVLLTTVAAFAKGGLGGLFGSTHVLPPPDPSPYVHTVKVSATAALGLNIHDAPHQAAPTLRHLAAGTKVATNLLLQHGEAYQVGGVNHTDWYGVIVGGKQGWYKRGWTVFVS